MKKLMIKEKNGDPMFSSQVDRWTNQNRCWYWRKAMQSGPRLENLSTPTRVKGIRTKTFVWNCMDFPANKIKTKSINPTQFYISLVKKKDGNIIQFFVKKLIS